MEAQIVTTPSGRWHIEVKAVTDEEASLFQACGARINNRVVGGPMVSARFAGEMLIIQVYEEGGN